MKLTLEADRSGDIAVLHGIDSDAALAHLSRSVTNGVAFDNYRALVVDLQGHEPITAEVARGVSEAAAACEHRQHQFVVVSGSADVERAVHDVRRWFKLVDGRLATNSAAIAASTVIGLVMTAAQWSIKAARAAIDR